MIATKTLQAMGARQLRPHTHFWTSPWRGWSAMIGQRNMPFPGGVFEDPLHSNSSGWGWVGEQMLEIPSIAFWSVPEHKHAVEIFLLETIILLLKFV